jgi:hypothetical protein
MCENAKRHLEEKISYSREFIKRATQAFNLIPYVQKELEYTLFELDVINSSPKEVSHYFNLNSAYYKEDAQDIKKRFELPPDYQCVTAPSNSSAALTMSVVKEIEQYYPTATAITWATEVKSAYESIIEKSSTKDFIKKGIERLNYKLIILFEDAEDDFDKYKVRAMDAKKVALSMRIFIEKLNGEIIYKARNWQKEKIRLEEAIKRITILSEGSYKYQQLITMAETYKSGLFSDISNIVHDRGPQKKLTDVHVNYIEFLNIVLSAI